MRLQSIIASAFAGSGSTDFLSGLVAYWDFSESSAPFVSKAGTAGPVALVQGPGSAVTKVSDGPTGNAVRFNGTSDYLICEAANTGLLNIGKNGGNNVTVLAFIKPTNKSSGHFIAGLWQENNTNPRRQYGLFYNVSVYGGTNRSCMHISKTGDKSPGLPYSRDVSANFATQGDPAWSCISGSYDGSLVRSYWDGRFEPYPNYTEPNAPDGQGLTYDKNPYAFNLGLNTIDCDFTVGAVRLTSAMGNFMQGDIANIMVFNRTLSQSEISKIQRYVDSANSYGFRNSFFKANTTVEPVSSLLSNAYHGATCIDTSDTTSGASFGRGNTTGNGYVSTSATPTGIRAFTCEVIQPGITTENLQTISIEQANVNIADAFRLMVKINGNWYASEQSYGVDVASTGAGDWANSKVSNVNFSKAAAGWRDVVINPGVALTLAGAARSSDLPTGTIQGYGVIRATTPAGSMRFRNIVLKVSSDYIA